ncbi:hypothetical protein ACTMTI_16785 [Nonomuraea sp. H19]|uniref:hypothetical protein n=1 Tax=Nonomuraea sp. H19 TaxID=3452206 RepID=UPI003F8BB0DA
MLDAIPADYRAHELLRRHPIALGSMVIRHVNASVEAARAGYRSAAVDLKDHLPPHVLSQVFRC